MTPDRTTFLNILGAGNDPPALEYGKLVHAVITNARAESDAQIGAALESMYCKCEAIELARETFEGSPIHQNVEDNFRYIGSITLPIALSICDQIALFVHTFCL